MIKIILLISVLFANVEAEARDPSKPRKVDPRGPLDVEESINIKIFDQAGPSVVHIRTLGIARDIFSMNVEQIPKGSGSGFVWDEDGHIVTNFHVIQNADIAQVTLSDQTTWKGKLVGIAPEKDLAVLQIDAPKSKLKPIPIGTSEDLKVGQKTFAIGNPFGLDHTLTTGIVSALGREIDSLTQTPIKNVIQTDAAINPGNSGGPLLDSAGRLIGVNAQIFSPSGAYAGIGFAIPVETVNWVVPDLIAYGKLIRPSLGTSFIPDRIAWQFEVGGAVILDVTKGGPADVAGLRSSARLRDGRIKLGDIIAEIDGTRVRSAQELQGKILGYKVGDTVTLTVLRDRNKVKVKVTLAQEKS